MGLGFRVWGLGFGVEGLGLDPASETGHIAARSVRKGPNGSFTHEELP